MASEEREPDLVRGLGLWQATALNITMIVGAGVFVTIPGMLTYLPGPYALLGWLAAGALIVVDGLIWGELGAALPGSGGSYRYLLECYGRQRWGRLIAFLFIWQFLLSGPLELGSGLAAMAQFATALSPEFQAFNESWTWRLVLWPEQNLSMSFGPARMLAFGLGVLIVVLLYRRITTLGRMTVVFWLGVLAVIAWVLVEGWLRFDPARAFNFSGAAPPFLPTSLGPAMVLAMYAYLGYYNVCYVGDEVRDPGRTIPRAILLSAIIVVVLFVGLHLAMLGTVPWWEVQDSGDYSLPAEFMRRAEGPWAVSLLTLLLIWCCFGSAFCGLLGYSRVPYGAARQGHFFAVLGRVDPVRRVPHVSLLLVGGLMLFWTFFDLQNIINALIATRILEQFIGQAVGVMLLRRYRPELKRPWKMCLYPLPCLVAIGGWLYLYASSGWLYVGLGAATLVLGAAVFFVWSWRTGGWPFDSKAVGSR
jgi:basic amino acid/polyamine antiporter, APA family